jgi:hypothetical protein
VSNTGVIVGAIVLGFFLVPVVAGAAPEVINGVLLLLILGALLLNGDVWLPYLTQLGAAFTQPAPEATGKVGGGKKP